MIDTLKGILACPTCRQAFAFDEVIYCRNCKKEVVADGRLLDFSRLTPDLPLYFARLTKDLHEHAGEVMEDFKSIGESVRC